MRTDLVLNGSTSPAANYIAWAPRPATIRLTDATGATGPVAVTLRNQRPTGGQVVFFTDPTQPPADKLALRLPQDGTKVNFFVAGKFKSPSMNDKDAAIEVVNNVGGAVLSLTQLMVRVRKDANTLTAGERDRFVAAFAQFNNRGMGRFSEFRDMHRTDVQLRESHRNHGFLPWHRAYLLDLERELQAIDPSVALHYWRFDKKADKLFTQQFIGETVRSDSGVNFVKFAPSNPLQFWKTDNGTGVDRGGLFNTLTSSAAGGMGPVLTEAGTIRIGEPRSLYETFVDMEGQPHGAAHVSFSGFINNPATAPRDPLFFLLHCNVDRLWAMWQWLKKRLDASQPATYKFRGKAGDPGATRVGHNLLDTMWPWNGVTTSPRPNTAPGGDLARSIIAAAPPPKPTVGDMIDWQGKINTATFQGFDYDDVPFEA
jgi:tyrosinase